MAGNQMSECAAASDLDGTHHRRRISIALGIIVLILLIAVAGLYWRWRNNADDLYSADANGISMTGPLNVGGVMYVNSNVGPRTSNSGHRFIELHRVAPRLTTNTAHATVTVLLCRVADPDLGVGMEPDTTPCATVRPFHPGKVDLGFPATEVIYKITATHPGTLRISGADVNYSATGRNGNQHVGSGILVRVSHAH